MRIGCHVSIAGGIGLAPGRASSLGCETFQVFTQNQRQWKSLNYTEEQSDAFKKERLDNGYESAPLVSHASYLINMCSNDPEKLERSRQGLYDELKRCDQLGINYLVIHPGAHGGRGSAWGIEQICQTINLVYDCSHFKVELLLESTAGQGNGIGSGFKELADIIAGVDCKQKVAVCLDTCHIFAAGYPVDSEAGWQQVLAEGEETFGLEKVKVWHLNDSLKEKGSRRDRHAPVGEGHIGLKGFEVLMGLGQFSGTAGILEIPGGDQKFAENIKLLKEMRSLTS